MKKRIFFVLMVTVTAFSFCGCNKTETIDEGKDVIETNVDETDDNIANNEDAASGEEESKGYPWVNSNIYENYVNAEDVSLKDDYALAVNREWQMNHPMEEGNAYYPFSFGDTKYERIDDILADRTIEGHDAELVFSLYDAFLDWDSRNELGVEPMKDMIEEIERIENVDDVIEYERTNASVGLFPMEVVECHTDFSEYELYFESPILFLGDPRNYNMPDASVKNTYDAEKKKVETVLTKCGYTEEEADDIFKEAIGFEQLVCEYVYTYDEIYYDADIEAKVMDQVYNEEELSQIKGCEPYVYLAKDRGAETINKALLYENMEYFNHFDDIFNSDNIEMIKDYLIAHTASKLIKYLDEECYDSYIEIQNEFYGETGYSDKKDYAVEVVEYYLEWPLSKVYCERFVTAEDKKDVEKMAEEIIEECKLMISEDDALSEETKKKTIDKLDDIIVKSMYPDEWPDYGDLELSGGYKEMVDTILTYKQKKVIQKSNMPHDRNEWEDTPLGMDFYIDYVTNSIEILPGFITDTFYNKEWSKEQNYAMLGTLIGRTVFGVVDPVNVEYDIYGYYHALWTEEERAELENRSAEYVNYLNNVVIWDGLSCDGELKRGFLWEDVNAMACILRIAKKDDSFDYDEFFKNYSLSYANTVEPEYVEELAYNYPQLPDYLSVNAVLVQFDEFYDTYDIKEGDGMYLAPEDRMPVWGAKESEVKGVIKTKSQPTEKRKC